MPKDKKSKQKEEKKKDEKGDKKKKPAKEEEKKEGGKLKTCTHVKARHILCEKYQEFKKRMISCHPLMATNPHLMNFPKLLKNILSAVVRKKEEI